MWCAFNRRATLPCAASRPGKQARGSSSRSESECQAIMALQKLLAVDGPEGRLNEGVLRVRVM
jgi:hypothetical protein